jgi:hypothetical protein
MPGQHMMNPAMSQSMTQAAYPVPHAEYSTDTVIYKGGPPNQRGPLPQVSLVQPMAKASFGLAKGFVQESRSVHPIRADHYHKLAWVQPIV